MMRGIAGALRGNDREVWYVNMNINFFVALNCRVRYSYEDRFIFQTYAQLRRKKNEFFDAKLNRRDEPYLIPTVSITSQSLNSNY